MCKILVFLFIFLLSLVDGEKRNITTSAVMGGRLAKKREFPFAVRIGASCGGTLVRADALMTAAHCVYLEGKGLILMERPIIAGVTNINDVNNPDYQSRKIKNVKMYPETRLKHPKLDLYYHDIAMIELDEPFKLTEAVQVAKIVSADPEEFKKAWYKLVDNGDTCYAMGWGTTCTKDGVCDNTGPNSDDLRVLETIPWTDERCGRNVPSNFDTMTGKGEVCTSFKGDVGKNRIGQGDSGGPFFCNGFSYGVLSTGSFNEKAQELSYNGFVLYWPYIEFFQLQFAAKASLFYPSIYLLDFLLFTYHR